jgi:hypothetical protein
MVEIGGTVGDIESQPFLEAIRQLRVEVGAQRAMLMHLTYVPYIPAAGEIKTKPTQHSVKELRSIGLQPDVLVCRSDRPLPRSARARSRCSPTSRSVRCRSKTSRRSTRCRSAARPGRRHFVVERLGLECPAADLSEWQRLVDAQAASGPRSRIAFVGKYLDLLDAYKSLIEAITHAGIQNRTKVLREYRRRGHRAPGHRGARRRRRHPGARRLRPARLRRQDSRRAVRPREQAFPTWASATGCRSRSSSSPATCWAGATPTPPRSTPARTIRSSA